MKLNFEFLQVGEYFNHIVTTPSGRKARLAEVTGSHCMAVPPSYRPSSRSSSSPEYGSEDLTVDVELRLTSDHPARVLLFFGPLLVRKSGSEWRPVG